MGLSACEHGNYLLAAHRRFRHSVLIGLAKDVEEEEVLRDIVPEALAATKTQHDMHMFMAAKRPSRSCWECAYLGSEPAAMASTKLLCRDSRAIGCASAHNFQLSLSETSGSPSKVIEEGLAI